MTARPSTDQYLTLKRQLYDQVRSNGLAGSFHNRRGNSQGANRIECPKVDSRDQD
jgi:hypothetical protein